MRFYIAHTITERHWVRDKLCPALQALGFETSNPFYTPDGKPAPYRPEIIIIDKYGENSEFFKKIRARQDDIVDTDIKLIDESDGIVAFMNEPSVGTSSEMFYGGFIQKKPVFLITYNERNKKHPWILKETRKGGIFSSLDELITYLRKKYKCQKE